MKKVNCYFVILIYTDDKNEITFVTNAMITYTVSAEDVANLNPLRYRCYYFENDLDMYYLQSRYYMPYLYRFLNADDPQYAKVGKDDTTGINLFAYCNNDPVNNSDPTGCCYFSKNGKWCHDSWEYKNSGKKYYMINSPKSVNKYTIKGRLDVDTDGASEKLGSSSYQKTTSLKISGNYIDAKNINYIVYKDSKYKGCIASITNNKTHTTIFAIVADYATDLNEFSYRAVNSISPRGVNKQKKKIYWNGNCGPENVNISVIIFNSSKSIKLTYNRKNPSGLQNQINGYEKNYFDKYNYYKRNGTI